MGEGFYVVAFLPSFDFHLKIQDSTFLILDVPIFCGKVVKFCLFFRVVVDVKEVRSESGSRPFLCLSR